jgi:zinc transporter 9
MYTKPSFRSNQNFLFSYGYSNMTYITSLISGVGIFCFGTGLAWYHGVLVLLHPQEMESLFWVCKL